MVGPSGPCDITPFSKEEMGTGDSQPHKQRVNQPGLGNEAK